VAVEQYEHPEYTHPYQTEIEQLQFESWMLAPNKVQKYKPLSDTPLTWVDTEAGLNAMCTKLDDNSVQELAIDLENHSYHSFQGFLCLMQLSTRSEDFIIDLLALRTSVQKLNEYFTDPAIVKVLHGGDSDILWLQRDHGLYIVNMFDTGQAARVMEYPGVCMKGYFAVLVWCANEIVTLERGHNNHQMSKLPNSSQSTPSQASNWTTHPYGWWKSSCCMKV
jgi:hypothetical protein